MSAVSGCDVTTVQLHYTGSTSHASSRREAVSDSRGVPRCTEKNFKKSTHAHMCRVQSSYLCPEISTVIRHHTHLPGELVSLSSVPIPSIDLNLWNLSRPSAFVPMSLGFTSVLTDDIVTSFRNTKS